MVSTNKRIDTAAVCQPLAANRQTTFSPPRRHRDEIFADQIFRPKSMIASAVIG